MKKYFSLKYILLIIFIAILSFGAYIYLYKVELEKNNKLHEETLFDMNNGILKKRNEKKIISNDKNKISIKLSEIDSFKYIKYFHEEIGIDQVDEIVEGIDEFVYRIGIINYRFFTLKNGYIKHSIELNGDRTDLKYLFFIKGDELYGIRKIRTDYNPPKWESNSKIDSNTVTDCYKLLNNCGKDELFLYDFIKKFDIEKENN